MIFLHPEDSAVNESSSINFTCSAYGVPAPVILWTKLDDDGDMFPVSITSELEGYTNGSVVVTSTLAIHNAATVHAGTYMCTAENDVIGNGTSTVDSANFTLIVQSKHTMHILIEFSRYSNLLHNIMVHATERVYACNNGSFLYCSCPDGGSSVWKYSWN